MFSQGTVDSREQFYRPYWAGASQGMGVETQNYFSPTKAIDIQFGISGLNDRLNRKPVSMDTFYNGEPFGKDVLNYSAPYKEPLYRNFEPGPHFGGTNNYRPPLEYGTPRDWLSGIFEALKNFFLAILEKLGLKKSQGVIGTQTNTQSQTQTQAINYTQNNAGQTSFDQNGARIDASERIDDYSSPFDTHTILFGRQVVP